MKIFISGSAKINTLNETIERILNKTVNSGHEILVGDCNGVDALIQSYYSDKGYENVTVYHVGAKPRNCCKSFTAVKVDTANETSGYRYYQQKDIRMTDIADVGLVIWDGISKGSYANMERLLKAKKSVVVHLFHTGKTYTLYYIRDLMSLKEIL